MFTRLSLGWHGTLVTLTALSMAPPMAHVLELAPKMATDPEFYSAVNGTLYPMYAYIGE